MYQRVHAIKEYKGHEDIINEFRIKRRCNATVTRLFPEDTICKANILDITKKIFVGLFPERKIREIYTTPESFTVKSDIGNDKESYAVVAVFLPSDCHKCAFLVNKRV